MDQLSLSVEEYTTPSPITAEEDTPLDELIDLMKRHNIRHIPIVREDTVVGIVSDRDCRIASGLTQPEKRLVLASDIMTAHPVTVSAGQNLDDVALEMSTKKIGSVIVNDEDDKFLGIFTVTDALNALIEIGRASKHSRN